MGHTPLGVDAFNLLMGHTPTQNPTKFVDTVDRITPTPSTVDGITPTRIQHAGLSKHSKPTDPIGDTD